MTAPSRRPSPGAGTAAPRPGGPAGTSTAAHGPGWGFWVAMGLGGAVTTFGAVGLLTAEGSGLTTFIPYFAGGALLVDLVVVPLAAGLGLVGRRALPRPVWLPVRAGLLATAVLAVFATPLVLGLGGRPDNASLRPRHYGSGLVSALAVVWTITALTVAASMVATRRRPT